MRKLTRTILLGLAGSLISFGLVAVLRGADIALAELRHGLLMLVDILPQLGVGLVLASLVGVLVSRDLIVKWLGSASGIKGIMLATGIGAALPGGPFASFPLLVALARGGADMGALVALLVSWATIGIYRVLIWELPLMGAEFALLRLVCSIPLPILAGLLARFILRRFPALAPKLPT